MAFRSKYAYGPAGLRDFLNSFPLIFKIEKGLNEDGTEASGKESVHLLTSDVSVGSSVAYEDIKLRAENVTPQNYVKAFEILGEEVPEEAKKLL